MARVRVYPYGYRIPESLKTYDKRIFNSNGYARLVGYLLSLKEKPKRKANPNPVPKMVIKRVKPKTDWI